MDDYRDMHEAELKRYKAYYDAIDEEAVTTFTLNNDLSPKEQLHAIINWHVQVATDPKVNGGYQLVMVESNECCATCRYGRPSPVATGEWECRYNPPTDGFPSVEKGDWCREYTSRE